MDCASCGHRNRDGARFCAACAAPLSPAVACPACGASQPEGARFCDRCGAVLVEPRASRGPPHVRGGERKQVTVLFADVRGSMELTAQLDAEAWQRVMDRFFSILSAGVVRFEGTVDKFTGDGVMAVFGAPVAQEDHARRACLAALGLQQDLAAYGSELRAEGVELGVRMGLNSGEVVVGAIGEDGGTAWTALGHPVGLAQRMEQLAAPGAIYLTERTAALVTGHVALRDLGEREVKGVLGPLRVHELMGPGPARGRLDVARARGFTRFVGREDELLTLERARERAFAGDGLVLGVVGEAGVGKSRLCHEFLERRRVAGTPVLHIAAQPHTRLLPLLPVVQLLRAYFGIGDRDAEPVARDRVVHRLAALDQDFEEDLPLLFDVLAMPDPERPVPRMDPDARQRRLLALTRRLFAAESRREPGVTLVEDLHWLDPASEVFLAHQVEAAPGTRSLLVVNFRPEYHAAWMSRSHYAQIALGPLAPEATEALLGDLLGGDPSLDGLAPLVGERTRGNPFFVEEVVQSLVEEGRLEGERGAYRLVAPVVDAAVPATVQATLAARIDRLEPDAKAVLQAAAVIGREFDARVLQRVVGLGPAELEGVLGRLVAAELVHERAPGPEGWWAFKHPLTQEVAYRAQLRDRRAAVHAAVARALAEADPGRLDERAGLLAGHWEAAGEELEAARWHARAAVWAGTSAPAQALAHWRRVRDLADQLPEGPESVALGLTARMLGLQYSWRMGLAPEEAEAAFREAHRLAVRAGDVRSQAILLNGYGAARGVGDGEVREFARLQREAIALAEAFDDPALYVSIAPGSYALFCTGAYREAVATVDRALELSGGDPTLGGGVNYLCPYAWCHGFKGMVLVILGELDEARRLIDRCRRIAGEQGDLEVVGFSHLYATYLGYVAGEPEAALLHARRGVEIAERIGDAFSRVFGWISVGLAEQMRGEWQRAIDATERAVAIARAHRTAIDPAVLLGDSYLALGDAARARAVVTEGLASAREQGHVLNETLSLLALARVLLGSGDEELLDEAGAALADAARLTRDTGARGLEPIVHVELAELARRRGDDAGYERELREAHRRFVAIGAHGRAEEISIALAASGL